MLDPDHLTVPWRKGGLGLQCLTSQDGLVCKAGFVAAAALMQEALATTPESLQPFKGESGKLLPQVWGRPVLHAHAREHAHVSSCR